jgi:GTP cyclohydrolase IA
MVDMAKNSKGDVTDPQILAEHYRALIEGLGEDVHREGLRDTPMRAAKAMQFLTRGYSQRLEDIVNNALFESKIDEIVLVKDIELYSLCEHHLLPFIGRCHVGYLPNGRVLGLSKVARIVDMFARRLQIQEQLTQQIAEAIMNSAGARGVGVIIEARHLCMAMRGVEKQNSVMKTSVLLGSFRDNAPTRSEFLQLVA